MSLAYIESGNFGTDITGGSVFNYDLIWAVWMRQRFRNGIRSSMSGAGNRDRKQSCTITSGFAEDQNADHYPYWLAGEIACAATDLAEYLGTVIALNILFNIPLIYAAIFEVFGCHHSPRADKQSLPRDKVLFHALRFDNNRRFPLRAPYCRANLSQIAIHSISPSISSSTILVVVGIVGATVMPHVLWLHSSLTSTNWAAGDQRR